MLGFCLCYAGSITREEFESHVRLDIQDVSTWHDTCARMYLFDASSVQIDTFYDSGSVNTFAPAASPFLGARPFSTGLSVFERFSDQVSLDSGCGDSAARNPLDPDCFLLILVSGPCILHFFLIHTLCTLILFSKETSHLFIYPCLNGNSISKIYAPRKLAFVGRKRNVPR